MKKFNRINTLSVVEKVKNDILAEFTNDNGYKGTPLQALKSQIDNMRYTNDNLYNTADRLVSGGTFECYYNRVESYLKELNLSISETSNQKNWDKYKHLLSTNIVSLYESEEVPTGVLKLEIKRVNNSINGNPRYKILNYDNEILMNYLIKKGDFRDLKKGLYTKSDACFGYGIENKQGVEMHGIKVLSTRIY